MKLSDLKGKKIALLGVGLENIYLAEFLLKKGVTNIELRDQKSQKELISALTQEQHQIFKKLLAADIKSQFGADYLLGLEQFDIIFRTPGLSYLTPEIQEAKKAGAIISSQIKLFFDLCPAIIIGVTGTKGKGTTSKLIEEILKKGGDYHRSNSQITTDKNLKFETNPLPADDTHQALQAGKFQNQNLKKVKNGAIKQWNNVYLLGNIGEAAISYLDQIQPNDVVILELSSFQLQDLEKSPHIAVVTNLDQDHLDYHRNLHEYQKAKESIVKYQNQTDFAVINQDYEAANKLRDLGQGEKYFFSSREKVENGAYVDFEGKVILTIKRDEIICRSDEIKLIGRHNLENIAAAAIAGYLMGVGIKSIKKAVTEFRGLPHRLEFIAQIDGVKYFNDSFSTNPIPTIAAIRSFREPIILILGGSSKGADFTSLAKQIADSSVKAVITIGIEGTKIKKAIEKLESKVTIIDGANQINEIVGQVKSIAGSGDIVLFSPACASFDMFLNYKDRGEKFVKAVKKHESLS